MESNLPQTISSESLLKWVSTQTVDTILQNRELKTFRNLNNRKTSEQDREQMKQYRVIMAGTLANTLNYLRTAVSFNKEMVIEFVDMVIRDFPNWKPEDFFLFCRYVKEGRFKTEFEHAVDYPMLTGWLFKYDGMILDSIESERITDVPLLPEFRPQVEPGEVERELAIFYETMRQARQKKEIERRPEPRVLQLQKDGFFEYNKIMENHIRSLNLSSPYAYKAERDLYRQQNPPEAFIDDYIKKRL